MDLEYEPDRDLEWRRLRGEELCVFEECGGGLPELEPLLEEIDPRWWLFLLLSLRVDSCSLLRRLLDDCPEELDWLDDFDLDLLLFPSFLGLFLEFAELDDEDVDEEVLDEEELEEAEFRRLSTVDVFVWSFWLGAFSWGGDSFFWGGSSSEPHNSYLDKSPSSPSSSSSSSSSLLSAAFSSFSARRTFISSGREAVNAGGESFSSRFFFRRPNSSYSLSESGLSLYSTTPRSLYPPP